MLTVMPVIPVPLQRNRALRLRLRHVPQVADVPVAQEHLPPDQIFALQTGLLSMAGSVDYRHGITV